MKRYILLGAIVASAFLSCNLANPGHTDPALPSIPAVNTKIFEQQYDGSYLFETNDNQYITTSGKSFISYSVSPVENGAFTYTVAITKNNGNQNGGYGLIFQRVNATNLWFFDIDINGYFCLGKYVDGDIVFVFDPPWKYSPAIRTGYGTQNTVKVVFNGNADYEIVANDDSVVQFTDSAYGTPLRGGCFGITVDVMPSEYFPDKPVSVLYQIINPLNISLPQGSSIQSFARSLGAY